MSNEMTPGISEAVIAAVIEKTKGTTTSVDRTPLEAGKSYNVKVHDVRATEAKTGSGNWVLRVFFTPSDRLLRGITAFTTFTSEGVALNDASTKRFAGFLAAIGFGFDDIFNKETKTFLGTIASPEISSATDKKGAPASIVLNGNVVHDIIGRTLRIFIANDDSGQTKVAAFYAANVERISSP